LNISKFIITNTRVDSTSTRNKLENHLELFKKTNFFQQTQWPFSNSTTTATTRISPLFEKHPYDTYLYNNPLSKKTCALPQSPSASKAFYAYYTMTTDSLKKVRIAFFLYYLIYLHSLQNMIFGILMRKIFIWILHQHHWIQLNRSSKI